MGDDGGIARYYLNAEQTKWMYVLCPRSGGKTFMDNLVRTDRDRAARIRTTATRIFDNGIEWALESHTIVEIAAGKGSIAVFETRVKGSVIRVATYLYEKRVPIYLFDFKTHPGSRNNLPRRHIDRAIQLTRAAERIAPHYPLEERRTAYE